MEAWASSLAVGAARLSLVPSVCEVSRSPRFSPAPRGGVGSYLAQRPGLAVMGVTPRKRERDHRTRAKPWGSAGPTGGAEGRAALGAGAAAERAWPSSRSSGPEAATAGALALRRPAAPGLPPPGPHRGAPEGRAQRPLRKGSSALPAGGRPLGLLISP